MKNGTAMSGKLSAPLMMFWATICEAKICSECISAMPQTISANAIGMPSAMAPSREKVNTARVTPDPTAGGAARPFAFLHRDQIFLGSLAAQDANEIKQQDDGGG